MDIGLGNCRNSTVGGAAMGGLAYLLGEYRSLRDRDWT
jgi:hypothetical protein